MYKDSLFILWAIYFAECSLLSHDTVLFWNAFLFIGNLTDLNDLFILLASEAMLFLNLYLRY
jgi:hypothetical protein